MKSMPVAKRLMLLFSLCSMAVQAQDQAASETDMTDSANSSASAQANNPLANFTAFNLHNYYIPELSGPVEETANSFILRYTKPFGRG